MQQGRSEARFLTKCSSASLSHKWEQPRLPAPLPRLAVVEFTLKDFPKRRVREAIETSDGVELPHVDVAVGHAGWIDMEKHRLADCERVSVGAELHNLMQLAFEMDRGLFNPRRLDLHARNRSEAGFGKLRVVLGDGVRGVDHLPPHRPRDHVEAELAGPPYVFQGMFLAAIWVARDRQRDHRRDDADNGEKAERRQIGNPRDAQ